MSSVSETRLRRRPQQARSRRRVEEVLDAAERLLAAEGAGALSTTRVAAEAGGSVGTLYQWFPDKHAILEALALRYTDEFRALAAGLEPGDDPAGQLLDAFVDAFRARPAFRAMWFGGLRTEALRDVMRPAREEIAAALGERLGGDAVRARMCVLVADGLLREAFRTDPLGDPLILRETRALLRAYLDAATPAPPTGS